MTTSISRKNRIRRVVVVAIAAVAILWSAAAYALNADDIRNLQASGLSADVMVSVVQSSDSIELTEDDVEALRAEGVPEAVLEAVCVRIGCATTGTGGTGGTGTGGPNLDDELERQRQLEEERRQLEEQRQEEERERMREELERQQALDQEAEAEFEGLVRADRLFRSGDFVRAAAICSRFLNEFNPDPNSQEYGEALFCYVQSMHAAGFRHTIRSEALEAVLMGSDTTFFEDAFGILVDVANDADYATPQMEDLVDFSIGGMSQEFQDSWNYFLGRFFWIYEDFDRSLEMLGRVTSGAEEAAAAQYLSGVMYLDQQENRNAVFAFQEATSLAETNSSNDDVAELAFLALARIAYELYQFDAALYYYNQIPQESFRHQTALFESMWAYFLKQDWNRAIGAVHSLHSPYYDRYFHPELYVVEAATYMNTCNLDEAELALTAFEDDVRSLQAPVQEFIANTASPQEYWDAIATYYDRYDTNDAVALPLEAVRFVLADVDYVQIAALIEQLEFERDLLDDNLELLAEAGEDALAQIEIDLQGKLIDAGLRVSGLILDFDSELTDWNVRAREVAIEITSRQLELVREAQSGGVYYGDGRHDGLRPCSGLAVLAVRGRVLGRRGRQLPW